MNILFVPFLTDTQTAYSRVRHCAQARAIENECYVAIAGSVGNLPRVKNMDIQYAQSAVLTPCDFAFPNTGVKSEATPNTEMILVTDVDLSILDRCATGQRAKPAQPPPRHVPAQRRRADAQALILLVCRATA